MGLIINSVLPLGCLLKGVSSLRGQTTFVKQTVRRTGCALYCNMDSLMVVEMMVVAMPTSSLACIAGETYAESVPQS